MQTLKYAQQKVFNQAAPFETAALARRRRQKTDDVRRFTILVEFYISSAVSRFACLLAA